jgi:hypothetical protein
VEELRYPVARHGSNDLHIRLPLRR